MDAHDINLLGENTNTSKKNTEYISDASKGISLDVITKRTKYKLNISLLECGAL
jgi:hypothetical protein